LKLFSRIMVIERRLGRPAITRISSVHSPYLLLILSELETHEHGMREKQYTERPVL
jgi:hypothetical protein